MPNVRLMAIREQCNYEAVTDQDQTDSNWDESELTSLCGEEIIEHEPKGLLGRTVEDLYDPKKHSQVFRALDGEELAHRSAQKFFIIYHKQIGKGGQGEVYLCEIETPYILLPMTCVIK